MDAMKHLGYPSYIVPFLGVAKIIALIILLYPKKMRLKDWAYAGIVIDLLGASFSHFSVRDNWIEIITPLVGLALALTSYFLYLKNKQVICHLKFQNNNKQFISLGITLICIVFFIFYFMNSLKKTSILTIFYLFFKKNEFKLLFVNLVKYFNV